MHQNPRYLEELTKSSENAEKAFQAAFSPKFKHHSNEELRLWAALTILHCNILRYTVTYENSTTLGIVRLLWMGDIVSMLYEARKWFYVCGNPELIRIAISKGVSKVDIEKKIEEIKLNFPLHGVEKFKSFRNKAGNHYDRKFVEHLQQFSEVDSNIFVTVLSNYANYTNRWSVLCKEVLS